MSTYPNGHKQIIIISIVCVLVVIAAVIYVRPQLPYSQTATADSKIDVDADNLQDAATGTSDSDWKKLFNSTSSDSFKTQTSTTTNEKLTLTDQFSRNFFTNYIELRQSNLTSDQASIQNTMGQLIDSTLNSAPQPKEYNLSNVSINNNASSDDLRKYGNDISSIFLEYGPRANPASIAGDALDQSDPNMLKKIDPIITSYDKMVKAAIATTVPRALAQDHLQLINALSAMLFVSQEFKQVFDDPMQGMVSLKLYTPAQDSIRASLLGMSDYFNNNRIYFTNAEPGIFLSTVPQ